MQQLTKKNLLPFWKLKTFNEKLNATIAFIKVYWKQLLRANLLIAGPLFVFGIGLIIFYFNIFYNSIQTNPNDPAIGIIIGMVFSVLIGGLFYGISILAISMVTLEVVRTEQTKPEKLNDVNYIFNKTKKRLGKMLLIMILAVIANFIVNLIAQLAVIPFTLLGGLGALLIFPLYFFVWLTMYVFMYIIVPTAYYEKISTSQAISKGMNLVKGRFWQTAGMFLGAKAIQYIITAGIITPIIVAIFGFLIYKENYGGGAKIFTEEGQRYLMYLIMGLTFIYLVFSLLTNIFHVLTGAVQYYSLKEEKENNHLRNQIKHFETIGIEV